MFDDDRPYFQVELDDSFIDQCFNQVETKFGKTQNTILEIQRILNEKADSSSLVNTRESLQKEFNNKIKALGNRMAALETTVKSQLQNTQDSFEARVMELIAVLNTTMAQRLSEIEKRIPPPGPPPELAELRDAMHSLEPRVLANGKGVHLVRTSVQTVVSALGRFNDTCPTLDNRLPELLDASVNSANGRIQTLCGELEELKEQVKTLSLQKKYGGVDDVVNLSKFESTNFDITSIRPYPKATAQWPDPPNLPKIQPFLNLGEVVDYVYRLVPKLQVHLTVLHKKIIEQETELRTKMDKLMIEKVLERFQGIIRDVGTRMDEMQAALLQTASREEINEMLDNALACAPSSGETAVGQMMCMACGRPISQVTGALTREEAHRLLGTPPNSMVFKSPGQNVIGLIGETRAGFDSKIVETPCSVRSSRPASRTAASPGD